MTHTMTHTDIKVASVAELVARVSELVVIGYRRSDARSSVDTGAVCDATRYALLTFFRPSDGSTVQLELDI